MISWICACWHSLAILMHKSIHNMLLGSKIPQNVTRRWKCKSSNRDKPLRAPHFIPWFLLRFHPIYANKVYSGPNDVRSVYEQNLFVSSHHILYIIKQNSFIAHTSSPSVTVTETAVNRLKKDVPPKRFVFWCANLNIKIVVKWIQTAWNESSMQITQVYTKEWHWFQIGHVNGLQICNLFTCIWMLINTVTLSTIWQLRPQ